MHKKIILDDHHYNGFVDRIYCLIVNKLKNLNSNSFIMYRLFLRFLAINYYYFTGIDWTKCKKNKFKVYLDLQYIFWFLKYYPENYYSCRLWEKEKSEWLYYYGSIYDPLQRKIFRKKINSDKSIDIFENKYTCYCYCKNYNLQVPETFILFNPSFSSFNSAENILRENPGKKFILKFNGGKGGSGIIQPYIEDDSCFLNYQGRKYNLDMVVINKALILQEKIEQHECLSRIAKSLNTIRIITLLRPNNDVCVLGGYVRFGVGDSLVDNLSAGGLGVKLDIDSGLLVGPGYDRHWNTYPAHPTTGVSFDGYELPFMPEVVELIKVAQKRFFFHKLLGFDIAITPTGPVIVEINAEPDFIDFEVMVGPVLKKKDAYAAFKEYGLFINKYQVNLYGC